eukprot:GHVR01133822.1.p2 GENE.GHVR01133822.1~~GHVR01133822.1.p2  ORF type:complete len:111 (+),score=2.05 GHVR01133822.1:524-856(+)
MPQDEKVSAASPDVSLMCCIDVEFIANELVNRGFPCRVSSDPYNYSREPILEPGELLDRCSNGRGPLCNYLYLGCCCFVHSHHCFHYNCYWVFPYYWDTNFPQLLCDLFE